ncbi:MAG: hypothetical protein OEV65_05175 [Aquincola sp.]|nr:hypothetical protein [Aquincola sp.]
MAPLAALERMRLTFGAGVAERRLSLLQSADRTRLATAGQVRRLHELLCFIRAYPDDARILAQAERMLGHFSARGDLRAHRAALADSGIAGTAIHYRFFHAQAQWLADRWPSRLSLDRSNTEAAARVARALPLLVTPAESQALTESRLPAYEAIDRLRDRRTGDAEFLLRRIAAMPGDMFTREAFSDAIDASFVLDGAADTPSRTAAVFDAAPRSLESPGPVRGRPDLRAQLLRSPHSVCRLPAHDGAELADLARGAMLTRARALAAFSYADARDAWLVDDGDGLAFALSGVVPERRQAVAATYGGLTLRNRVPIGYLQADIVGSSAAISFNTFETFRGGEAAFTFARLLATMHHVFGSRSFTIEPYQLGQDNEEGLESGAWWFYFRLGFRPRDRSTSALARSELARVERRAGHRSSLRTLQRLAERHLFFEIDPRRPHPLPPLARLGLRAGGRMSMHAGAERERAVAEASAELARRCGLASLASFTRDERQAWERIAPIAVLLDLERWSRAERAALVALIRAKGGRSERSFVKAHVEHPRLDAALIEAAK